MESKFSIFKTSPLRIASRASELAIAQTKIVREGLKSVESIVCPITTRGDRIINRPLNELGGKGLFVKELERSIITNKTDVAVHSMKDMETSFAQGTKIGAVLPREDRRDALIGSYESLDVLPRGAKIGTASVRRAAILLSYRPDLKIKLIRGNVNRRLALLKAKEFDAIVLAVAGLKRLRLSIDYYPIDTSVMPSAAAQGAIAVQVAVPGCKRSNIVNEVINQLTCQQALSEVTAERSFLASLDGSCRTPVAASAVLCPTGHLTLDGMILRPDGSASYRKQISGQRKDAMKLGEALGAELLGLAGGKKFLAQ